MSLDWSEVFGITVSPWELVVRGTVMYVFLFFLFRVVIKRRVGSVGMADILVLVIIADAAQNGMAGDYRSVTEGGILIVTIVGWNMFADWLTFRSPRLRKLLEPPPLLLVDDGRVLYRHLRMELLAESELRSKLREQGVESYAEVAKAFMESDGQISVIKR